MAKHIIGGDMTYVCNGNGTYTVTMKVYRDCDSDGANYDSPANFGIFRGSTLIAQRTAGFQNRFEIPIADNPCVDVTDPPCVESATYIIPDIPLPLSDQSYTISYQRCCRNEAITNIVDPGGSGATYTIEITPEAQQSCNNSPVFNDFPPILICEGEYLSFDHSASDTEGDELVYSFCAPLLGGGVAGGPDDPNGDPNGPDGVIPIPPTGPPYNTVTYVAPTYSAIDPLVSEPTINISSTTGFITGIPTAIGQFVVGVCVEEYRNGVLIGEIQRDFQFKVIQCEPEVVADINGDVILSENEYEVNLCGDLSFDFISESIINTPDTTYQWSFDLGSSTFESDEDHAFVTFPGLGSYEGILVINPELVCRDTAFIYINVYPDITADFEFAYDTCEAAPVQFTDLSFGNGGIDEWIWDFGDGNTSMEQSPLYEYMIPGNFEVELLVRDTNNCTDVATADLSYFPAPETLIIDLDGFEGCAPEDVFFDNLSFPIDSTYTIIWDFGDGTTSNEISPVHTYNEDGIYSVSLDVTSPIGCEVSVPYNATIEIRPSPTAGFSYTPEVLSNFQPEAFFTDESVDAEAWQWNFGDGTPPVYTQNPSHTFETGEYDIVQVVRHESGCYDTATVRIISELLVTYYLPNAFTPNDDSKNEVFKGAGFFEGMTNFQMSIWNRWGEMIFLTNDPNEGWNGRKNNVGPVEQNGVYVVVVKYTDPAGEQINQKGFVTLIR